MEIDTKHSSSINDETLLNSFFPYDRQEIRLHCMYLPMLLLAQLFTG